MSNILETVRSDDFVEYFLYPKVEIKDVAEQERVLSSLLKEANKLVENLSQNYIWHKDEFKLSVKTSQTNVLEDVQCGNVEFYPHLYGITFYGDNIEDEWFIVYLLQEISKSVTDLVVRVVDSDGEFLLIEAADYLPSWANPERCEKRVYIYEGLVHLIPWTGENDRLDDVQTAIRRLTTGPATAASDAIQNSVRNRVSGYPARIADNLHRSALYVPTAVAQLLRQNPGLIAPSVLAFCNRDALDAKVCRAMKYFPPENRVYARVTFTKCLYAMLANSHYQPDRKTGWNLPPIGDARFKSHNFGLRVACGFEILANRSKPSTDLSNDHAWQRYQAKLSDKGYFKGLLEHSKEHNGLLNKAKEYFLSNRASLSAQPDSAMNITLPETADCDAPELAQLPADDDDSWLQITAEELDKMLQDRYGQRDFTSVNANTDPADFGEKLSRFLSQMSCVDGVEFPAEARKTGGKVSFSADTKQANDAASKPSNATVNFDANGFSCAVQNILNFVIPDDDSWDLDSESDMSEYEAESATTSMQQYMDEMDKQLATTTIGESFHKKRPQNGAGKEEDVEDFTPVDIDVNALKNMLESYRAQLGEAGPSSNLLGPMGLHFETDDD